MQFCIKLARFVTKIIFFITKCASLVQNCLRNRANVNDPLLMVAKKKHLFKRLTTTDFRHFQNFFFLFSVEQGANLLLIDCKQSHMPLIVFLFTNESGY